MTDTSRIYAGCSLVVILAIVVLCLSLMAAVLTPMSVHAESLEQATVCTPIAYVRVVNGLNASIRTSPEVTTDNRNRIGNLTYESGEKAAWEFKSGFYHLCEKSAKNEEQWVSATYNGGQKLLTVRVSTIPTPTYTTTDKPITPTRIPTITPGPSATPRREVWVEFSDGTIWQCELPCHFTIYDTLPDR